MQNAGYKWGSDTSVNVGFQPVLFFFLCSSSSFSPRGCGYVSVTGGS